MLVLSRKVGQELIIGDNVRITVNRIGGSRVTIGISAPDEVRIVRGELEPIVRSFEHVSQPAAEKAEESADGADDVEGVSCYSAWQLADAAPLMIDARQ